MNSNRQRCFVSYSILLLLTHLVLTNLAFAQGYESEHLHVEPAPSWVNILDVELREDIPEGQIRNGVYYQLLDNQIRVEQDGTRASYTRYTETAVNKTGVETSSQINIDFDPAYQKLVLNHLAVIRQGEVINKIDEARLSIFNREDDLDSLIYNGDLTLNVLLEDVQPGDTIDYSYTRFGANPVYKGLFSYAQGLRWNVPLYRQNLRVLWGKPSALNIETRYTDLTYAERELNGFTEYLFSMEDEPPLVVSSETPDWYDPYDAAYFNETADWGEVIDWAYPMYQFGDTHPDIRMVADQITASHKTTIEQIVAALQYVQERVRYVGLEMGQNSHMPTSPHETLALKYGDCKDKTALLIALLDALGVNAYPALVDTDYTKTLINLPAGVAMFNHVIVKVEFNDKVYWLDPTLSAQFGELDELYQPDYGYGLVLKEGEKDLTFMAVNGENNEESIVERYTIPESVTDAIRFEVESTYTGYEAMRVLWRLEQDGQKNVEQDYVSFYQRRYPGLSLDESLVVNNNAQSGVLRLDEVYSITEFWEEDEEGWETDFYPGVIRNSVYKPDDIHRNGPLDFIYPNNIKYRIEVTFQEDDWEFYDEDFSQNNDFYAFDFSARFDGKVLTLLYQFNAKTDNIPADKIEEYLSEREALMDNTYFGIMKYAEQTESETVTNDEFVNASVIGLIAILYILGITYVIIEWRMESGQRPSFEQSRFYPISPVKFVFMSIATLGIFEAYWMYRNWKAVKQQTGQPMMPIVRGIFLVLWLYPFYNALKKEHAEHGNNPYLFSRFIAVLLTVGYLGVSVFQWAVENELLIVLSMFALALLLLPFVIAVNQFNQNDCDAIEYNSKWQTRHVFNGILWFPLLGFLALTSTALFPSDEVIDESQLMAHHLKFFYRQKIIPANETILYFYSDAIWDIKEDGNGFTDNRVFSYWKDEDGVFQSDVALFTEVSDIEVEPADNEFDNTIVTITRDDSSTFILFVSAINDKDDIFVSELKQRWMNSKE
ncbi:DUF3857 domain-containing transglutaminase family protein [Alteromonas sp. KUL49]|uniref:DUF3857 domain-containing transglutaminase family protein n=1 Tax=Alteromonas sp. KUL49 TaxID=2480798 RepID=UPI0010FFB27F|nr:DUF3857 domain-containing transglutaminase family protein [Alteromonas sp. KUL49]GEA10595.1 hypothetical protein KUL49_09700 [Alteromonas sp. KUL49]